MSEHIREEKWFPCNNCGSTERASTHLAAKEIAANKIPAEKLFVEAKMVMLENPEQAVLTVPTLQVCKDVCWLCGNEQVFYVAMIDTPVKYNITKK